MCRILFFAALAATLSEAQPQQSSDVSLTGDHGDTRYSDASSERNAHKGTYAAWSGLATSPCETEQGGKLTTVNSGEVSQPRRRLLVRLTPFHYSIAALIASQSFDAASSMGLRELNPVLGRGDFGARQIAVKSSIVAALAVGEILMVKRWPRAAKALAYVNFGSAGITTGVAVRNERLR